ncbi:quinone oxidoreductase family protein [Alloalcanivorax mobilis]|uniref:quinone oxidoreductase family protein n=1 Tax=Alloalcanivorax mobilis TaxID=2019569 RepID=UPI000C782D52|nr:zinc-binding alcohol dehydrogenase family protein [Alloalcanivorax mobilis]
MKAAVLDALGSTPAYGDFDEPGLVGDETLIQVTAAAIKPLDRMIAAGTHYSSPKTLPVVCGMDGTGVDDRGQRVYFSTLRRPFGTMAERAPAAWTVPLPAGLDDAVAAAVVNPALAAWLPLVWRAAMAPGETVLIMGATGAAGHMAVKAARLLGAGRVIAAGRRQQVLAALDADATIDLRLPEPALREAFAEHAADINVVVDYVWGPPVESLIAELVSPNLHTAGGEGAGVRLVAVGEMAGRTVALPSGALRGSWLNIIGSGTGNFPPADKMRDIVAEILDYAASGVLEIDVERLPLGDVEQAWPRAGAGDRRLVLCPEPR